MAAIIAVRIACLCVFGSNCLRKAAVRSSWQLVERFAYWDMASVRILYAFSAWVAVTVGVCFVPFVGVLVESYGGDWNNCPDVPPLATSDAQKLDTSVKGLAEDKPIMSYSHELTEAVSEARMRSEAVIRYGALYSC